MEHNTSTYTERQVIVTNEEFFKFLVPDLDLEEQNEAGRVYIKFFQNHENCTFVVTFPGEE